MSKEFLGVGWQFPVWPVVDRRGEIALSRYEQDIQEAIWIILSTSPGERVMRPDFGCKIHDLAFASINAQTLGLVQRYVEEALGWWEPRVDVVDIEVTTDPSMRAVGKLIINIRYRVKATQDTRSLVYPFYLINEE